MATVPGAVIPIGGSGTIAVPYPPNAPTSQWTQLKIENASAYGLTLYFDGNPVHSIPAGVADVFPLSRGPSGPNLPATASVTVPAPQLTLQTVSEPNFGDTPGTIRPSFAQYGDSFPGVYPLALPSQAGPTTADTTGYDVHISGTFAGGNAPILAAPAAGMLWEIVSMNLWVIPPGTTAAGYVEIEDTVGLGHVFLILPLTAAAPGNIGSVTSSSKFTYSRAIMVANFSNAPNSSVGADVICRQVPVTYSPT